MRSKPFLVWDCETDPFQRRTIPKPFLVGAYDGKELVQWWGDDCIQRFIEWLKNRPSSILYAHNGGKFDFFFLPQPLGNPPRIVNGRIISAPFLHHELRDSFAILPFALAAYKKTEIDYAKFSRSERERNRREILSYHADDLRDTFDLVNSFRRRFGNKLTAPSAAIRELLKLHPIERKGQTHDQIFRPFMFGGRVECFRRGDFQGNWKLYDVNSMYPHVMREFNHPIGSEYEFTTDKRKLLQGKRPGFAVIDATSSGSLPLRESSGIAFPHRRALFHATLHEMRVAYRLGLLQIHSIQSGYLANGYSQFSSFVDQFAGEKIAAKESGDKIGELFAKLVLNSSYGKLAANPEKYYDYQFCLDNEKDIEEGWELYEDWGWFLVLRRPSALREFSFFDVATGASITGAARATLLEAIHKAKTPLYCDTDSIIAESLDMPLHSSRLGAWKTECEADRAIIIEKKLYCLTKNNQAIKKANKGVAMQLKDFISVIRGGVFEYERLAPTFQRDGSAVFINRKITQRNKT